MIKQIPLVFGSVLVGVLIGIIVAPTVTSLSSVKDENRQLYLVEYEGSFTNEEKTLAQNLILDPWMLFSSGNDREYDKVVVSKVGTDLPVFKINAYQNGKVATGIGFSPIKGQYDYQRWAPDCVPADCEGGIPEEFAKQYPELVIRAKAIGRRSGATQ